MGIRAIAFDLDDTLLRDDLTISEYTIDVLRRAARQGYFVIPASGRARKSMWPFVEQIGCAAAFIACNGAEIYSGDGQLLQRVDFPVETARAIAQFGKDKDIYMQTYGPEGFFYNRPGDYARVYARSSLTHGELVGDLTVFIQKPVNKLLGMAEPDFIAQLMAEAIPLFEGQAQVTCSKPYFIEFNPPAATKGNALETLGKQLGFTLAETLAFGDSLNDRSMLRAAGMSVPIGNARPELLEEFPEHAGTNMEDGVAHWLEEHLLEEDR